ncbi:c-type cytochrome biogenesis protein CcmI [Marinobacterium sp. MBR-109]|jgi:cytochrome c-type biogenesis protein CcmH|uniref:c-type cytochrome biogenesis protein CcmI n=1 Tax=Marinobacterium sp. MBR-109 TaxID=3156462 RepID=UPI0033984895
MSTLWIGIAVLTLIALACVFWPLVRHQQLAKSEATHRQQQNIDIFRERLAELESEREQGTLAAEEFATLKLELERNLLIDAEDMPKRSKPLARVGQAQLVTVTLLALMIPAAALGLYNHLGRADDLALALNAPASQGSQGEQMTLEQAVAGLERELAANPDNAQGWYLLANTYMSMGNYAGGAEAFRELLQVLPQDAPQYASVMGQLAQALYFAGEARMTDEVRAQIDATLAIDPTEIAALGLLGIDAFEQQDFNAAIEHWSKALAGAEGQAADSLRSGIERARSELEARGEPVPDIEQAAQAEVKLRVSLSTQLAEQAQPDQVVFIYARPVGGRMPLAAARYTVSDLPVEVVLDDSMAMMPQARLSLHDQVEVGARISLSGQPQASSGDLESRPLQVSTRQGDEAVTLIIDQVVQ